MTNARVIIRTVQPHQARPAVTPTHLWEGCIHSLRFDGERLQLVFDAVMSGCRPVIYFTRNADSVFLRYFLKPGDGVRIGGVVARDGWRGLECEAALSQEEIDQRWVIAERLANRFKLKIKLLREGHSEAAADRLVDIMEQ